MSDSSNVRKLGDLDPGEAADFFVLLAAREQGSTRDGRPFYRTVFRDAGRSATAMVWHDSSWYDDCDTRWQVGEFFKIRGRYYENRYGSQVEIEQIRPVTDEDREAGFDPAEFFESSRRDPQQMFDELLEMAREQIRDVPLRELTVGILEAHQETLLTLPAASRNHHAFTGGFLEHVLSVTRTAIYFADKYAAEYPAMEPPLSASLVVAGAILHDIGKLQELRHVPPVTEYTPSGRLIGHILLGRDMVREAARSVEELDPELLLRLEHIIVAHQNLPEWGSPVSPQTPEALLVHYADDVDAKFQMMAAALREKPLPGDAFTSRNNPLRRGIFRGLEPVAAQSERETS